MYSINWIKVRVTEWIEDTDEKVVTSHGRLTNREWLQREKRRIGWHRPHSRPFIGIHPKYFDKDSHGRRRHMQIALFQYVNPAEEKLAASECAAAPGFESREHRLRTAAYAVS